MAKAVPESRAKTTLLACHEFFQKWNLTENFVAHFVDGLRKAGLDISDEPSVGNRHSVLIGHLE